MSNDNAENNISSMECDEREESHRFRFQNYFRVKPFNNGFTEYTENATIHGIKYLGERRRSFGEKLYWILIFTCCFTFLGICIRDIVVKWQKHPVILIEDDVAAQIFKIPFPAVTICPQIKVKYDKFQLEQYLMKFDRGEINTTVIDLDKQTVEIAQQICSDLTKEILEQREIGLRDNLDLAHIPILYEVSPTLQETVLITEYGNNFLFVDEGKDIFSEVLTNEGVCFTFNVPQDILRGDKIQKNYKYNSLKRKSLNWDANNGYNLTAGYFNQFYPTVMLGVGKDFGLRTRLRSAVTAMNGLCQPVKNIAFKIVLHAPNVYPTTYEEYILVDYETVTNIAVTPKLIKTSENLRDYIPARRQCYFQDERRLKYFSYYNKVNCKLECLANFTMKMFNCVQFALPMVAGTPICGAKPRRYSQIYNYAETLELWAHMRAEKKTDEINSNLSSNYDKLMSMNINCDCLSECNSVEYHYKVTTEQIDFQLLNQFANDTPDQSSLNNMINIFLGNGPAVGVTRTKLYSFSDLVSKFGGLLGLFLGASILSLFEVVYFCAIRHLCKTGCKMYGRND